MDYRNVLLKLELSRRAGKLYLAPALTHDYILFDPETGFSTESNLSIDGKNPNGMLPNLDSGCRPGL